MRALLPLLAAALLTLAFSLAPGGSPRSAAADRLGPIGPADAAPRLGPAAPASPGTRPPLRLECTKPRSLLLDRFEDGSARLECAGRILVRISVPG